MAHLKKTKLLQFKKVTWLTEFRINRICVVLQKGYVLYVYTGMFRLTESHLVNPGSTFKNVFRPKKNDLSMRWKLYYKKGGGIKFQK